MTTKKGTRQSRDNNTWKQPYRKSRAIDPTCRCHGGCPSCKSAREHKDNKKIENLKEDETL